MSRHRLALDGVYITAISALEIGTPFARMLIMSHTLDLRELGIASLIAATYSMFEQVTDIAAHRYVFSTPADRLDEALASAQALALMRGVSVGGLAVALAPAVAALVGLKGDWLALAVLGPLIFFRSFENLAPRVAERNYRYGRQFGVVAVSSALSLLALTVAALLARSHIAVLFSLTGQSLGIAIASQLFSDRPYRLRVRSPFFGGAFRFGYPLMINGVGLALASQGDRFVVGSMLGLAELGQYAIVILAAIIPTVMVGRLTQTIGMAALHNARDATAYQARLDTICRVLPVAHIGYALALLTLFNPTVGWVFGGKFMVSQTSLVLLSSGVYFRLARSEPFTILFMHQGKTRRLALGNLISTLTVAFAAAGLFVFPHIEGAFFGKGVGEILAYVAIAYLGRRFLGASLRSYLETAAIFIFIELSVCALYWRFDLSQSPTFCAITVVAYFVLAAAWIAYRVPMVFTTLSEAARNRLLSRRSS